MLVNRKRVQRSVRQNSNVFAMFSQRQIAEFKEAFSFIDQNNDGAIDKRDLTEILSSLGHTPESIPSLVHTMMADLPPGCQESINFTLFLAMLGDRMQGTDQAEDLLSAFEILDQQRCGTISVAELRSFLTGMGDCLDDDEFDLLVRGVTISNGRIDYKALINTLTHADSSNSDEDN